MTITFIFHFWNLLKVGNSQNRMRAKSLVTQSNMHAAAP